MDQVDSLLNETVANNSTRVFTPDAGIASAALFFMAIVPIYIGCHKSIKAVEESMDPESTELTVLKPKEVAMFPIYASCTLFGIFLVFKFIAAEHINMLLSVYSFFLGFQTVFTLTRPLSRLLPNHLSKTRFTLTLTESQENDIIDSEDFKFDFDKRDVLPFLVALSTSIAYVTTKHWIANNIIGISIAISGIQYLHLDRVINGCILLGGLFVYDIFWVFGTGVMVFVATNFDAPVKMLECLDLVISFDVKLNRNGSRLYFWTGFIAYIIGLLLTFVFMYTFRHAQPALLYLVPTCLGFPLTMALIRGDFEQLMAYKDIPEEVEERFKASKEEKEKKRVTNQGYSVLELPHL
nr:Minor histocompatibility antigen H13 [Hymenolepis microstoma]